MTCHSCDEGYVERDRSIAGWTGHYTVAVREECPHCDGTMVLKCSYGCGRDARTHDEFSDPVCGVCGVA